MKADFKLTQPHLKLLEIINDLNDRVGACAPLIDRHFYNWLRSENPEFTSEQIFSTQWIALIRELEKMNLVYPPRNGIGLLTESGRRLLAESKSKT